MHPGFFTCLFAKFDQEFYFSSQLCKHLIEVLFGSPPPTFCKKAHILHLLEAALLHQLVLSSVSELLKTNHVSSNFLLRRGNIPLFKTFLMS